MSFVLSDRLDEVMSCMRGNAWISQVSLCWCDGDRWWRECERMKMRMLISLILAILNHPPETPPSLTTEEDNSQTVKAASSSKVGKHSSPCTPPDLSLKHVTDFQIATSEIVAWRCCNVISPTVRTPTQGSRTPLWKSKWLLASAAKTVWSCSLSAQRWV